MQLQLSHLDGKYRLRERFYNFLSVLALSVKEVISARLTSVNVDADAFWVHLLSLLVAEDGTVRTLKSRPMNRIVRQTRRAERPWRRRMGMRWRVWMAAAVGSGTLCAGRVDGAVPSVRCHFTKETALLRWAW